MNNQTLNTLVIAALLLNSTINASTSKYQPLADQELESQKEKFNQDLALLADHDQEIIKAVKKVLKKQQGAGRSNARRLVPLVIRITKQQGKQVSDAANAAFNSMIEELEKAQGRIRSSVKSLAAQTRQTLGQIVGSHDGVLQEIEQEYARLEQMLTAIHGYINDLIAQAEPGYQE